MNLALKYRPRTFDEVVGQRAPSAILHAMIVKQSLSQVLLFTGPSGVGKTTMARIVAAQLNPDSEEDVHRGTHPAVIEIDGASNGNVESIRALRKDLNFAIAGHRVVIIDEVHAISGVGTAHTDTAHAAAALLSILEFPPPHVTFILVTTEAHKIPVTIRHRCDHYTFRKASVEELLERLSHVNSAEGLGISPELLNLIAQRSEGSFRESLMLLEQIATAEIKTVAQYNFLRGEIDYGPSLVRHIMQGPSVALAKLEDVLRYGHTEEISDRLIETFRDVILLKSGVSLSHTTDALKDRKDLATNLTMDQILKCMKIIWDLQTRLGSNNPIRSLELAVSLMAEILKPIVTAVSQNNVMNLSQMRNSTT